MFTPSPSLWLQKLMKIWFFFRSTPFFAGPGPAYLFIIIKLLMVNFINLKGNNSKIILANESEISTTILKLKYVSTPKRVWKWYWLQYEWFFSIDIIRERVQPIWGFWGHHNPKISPSNDYARDFMAWNILAIWSIERVSFICSMLIIIYYYQYCLDNIVVMYGHCKNCYLLFLIQHYNAKKTFNIY